MWRRCDAQGPAEAAAETARSLWFEVPEGIERSPDELCWWLASQVRTSGSMQLLLIPQVIPLMFILCFSAAAVGAGSADGAGHPRRGT